MAGRLFGTFLIILFLTYMVLLSSFYFMHQSIVMNVNSLVYNTSETLSTSGVFTPQLYEYLSDTLSKYGNYNIKVKMEKQLKSGVYDTFYFDRAAIKDHIDVLKTNGQITGEALINKPLHIGDRITIYVEDQDFTLFGKLINATFLGYKSDRIINTRIKSLKTCVIAIDAKDMVKGYDVITDIKRLEDNTDNKTAILVKTKFNPGGKCYAVKGHPDLEVYNKDDQDKTENKIYGDIIDETEQDGNPQSNYILDSGDFMREIITYVGDEYNSEPDRQGKMLIIYTQK